MRKAKIHCKNCRHFLKNRKVRQKKISINPLMQNLISTGKEIRYDGVCIKSGKGVLIENKCNLWKYKNKSEEIRYNKCSFDNYECDGQLSINTGDIK